MSGNYFGALANVDFDAPAASSAPAPKKEAKAQTTTTSAPSQPATTKQQGGKQPTPSAQALKQGGAAQPKGSPQPNRAAGQGQAAGGQQGQGERGGRGRGGRGGRGRGNGEGFRGERRNYNQEGGDYNQEGGDRRNYNRPPRQQGQGQGQGQEQARAFSVEGAPQEGGSVRRGRGGYKNRGNRPENPQQNKDAQYTTGSDRVYDRRSGTGRPVHEQHKGGAGRRNWGNFRDVDLTSQEEVIASKGALQEGTTEAKLEKAASESDLASPVGADGTEAAKEPEGMSYKEFLAQKSKASIPSERRVEGAEEEKKAAPAAAPAATAAKQAAPAPKKDAAKGKKTGPVPVEQFFDVKVDLPSPDGERRNRGDRGGYGRGRGGRGGRGGRKQYGGNDSPASSVKYTELEFPSLNPGSPSQPRPTPTYAPAQTQQQAPQQQAQQPAAQQQAQQPAAQQAQVQQQAK